MFSDLGNEFYLVKFSAVMFDGPWIVSEHILAVGQWHPNFFLEGKGNNSRQGHTLGSYS